MPDRLLVDLVPVACHRCGVTFGLPEHYHAQRKVDGRRWSCPNGHANAFTDAVPLEQSRRRDLVDALHRAEQAEAAASEARAKLAAYGVGVRRTAAA